MIATYIGSSLALGAATDGWRELVGAGTPEPLRALLERAYQRGERATEYPIPLNDRVVRISVYPVRSGADLGVTGVVAVCVRTDDDAHEVDTHRQELIDQLQIALIEAEQASLAKDRFLATISHELRAPLTTLMLWEKVLREHADEPAMRIRALDAIRDSAAAQSRLVGDLLDVSRAISGKLFLDERRVKIDELVVSAAESIRPRAVARGLELEIETTPGVGGVLGDPARLRQVLDNLLSNAIKFTPPGGTVSIRCAREGANVQISVSDTGRGIAEHAVRTLFTPFSRTEDVLTRTDQGLGIGLSIAHQLVVLHGGTLTAHSDGPGTGAQFVITIPSAGRRSGSHAVEVAEAPIPRLDGISVLVVDDDPEVRDALGVLLNRLGTRLLFAASAPDARDVLAREHPDVILCDLGMPHEDGYSFMRGLRASEGFQKTIPAVALTAYAGAADRQRTAEVGFDAHVAKPVDLRTLAAMVRGLAAR